MVGHHRYLPWLLGNFWVQVTVGGCVPGYLRIVIPLESHKRALTRAACSLIDGAGGDQVPRWPQGGMSLLG